ncbi:hypothetical protein [Acidiluteibacter ferrifornacis]|uniref:Uncharacterized protein n=1 Tax=Acidiluteibacter ferrifornacis TaxID=2692424 RepID=A0A6N9NLL3_9FLAO|nr:hypothetical protein [Acidiluteibacter ferrifornacis]MBR9831671.1 hypothetical protein [bacterium]NBG66017.1 hypothetical protein [Acidiluteibacter ferrifornacis]
MKIAIQAVLLIAAVVLAYLVYDSVNSRIEFEKKLEYRKGVVVENLIHLRTAQNEFKGEKKRYAKTFDELFGFIKYDSISVIKAIGNVPDSLTEQQAVELGIVLRDTTKIAAIDSVLKGMNLDSLKYIPFSGGEIFKIDAGQIEKNKVNVNVFEVSAKYSQFLKGLSTKNENIDLENELKVGSMEEPTTSGNWE